MFELLEFEFMRNALAAGILTSIICGIIGTLVVVNRLTFLSGGIAHSAYGGIGLSFYLGLPWLPSSVGFALCSALVMAAVSLRARERSDTIIGVMWAVGMASGILLLDMTPGYNVDLMSYLFGSILSVSSQEIEVMAGAVVVIGCGVLYFFQDLMLMSYDGEFAQTKGVPVKRLYFLLVGSVAVTVVLVVQVVGLILVIALLTIPPSIAENYSKSLAQMMFFSCLLGICFSCVGLLLSCRLDLTSGAAIICVAGSVFFLQLLLEWYRKRVVLRRVYYKKGENG
ncbi:MAG: hypothetical protein CSB32_01640 [Desulfobacterales bacterium]|nr:MAG: hypothetical protein CSB32_01640 [Desulfobacterales bacterium]